MAGYESIFKKLPRSVRQIVLSKNMGPKQAQSNYDSNYASYAINEAKKPTGKKFDVSSYKSGGKVKKAKVGMQMKGTSPLLKGRR